MSGETEREHHNRSTYLDSLKHGENGRISPRKIKILPFCIEAEMIFFQYAWFLRISVWSLVFAFTSNWKQNWTKYKTLWNCGFGTESPPSTDNEISSNYSNDSFYTSSSRWVVNGLDCTELSFSWSKRFSPWALVLWGLCVTFPVAAWAVCNNKAWISSFLVQIVEISA